MFTIFMLMVLVFSVMYNVKAVAEETTVVLTPEMYTRSDQLLNADRENDPSTNIRHFAQTVVTASSESDMSDLTRIIPVEFKVSYNKSPVVRVNYDMHPKSWTNFWRCISLPNNGALLLLLTFAS